MYFEREDNFLRTGARSKTYYVLYICKTFCIYIYIYMYIYIYTQKESTLSGRIVFYGHSCEVKHITFHIYTRSNIHKGTRRANVIVTGNGIADLGSNPGWNCLHIPAPRKCINPTVFPTNKYNYCIYLHIFTYILICSPPFFFTLTDISNKIWWMFIT